MSKTILCIADPIDWENNFSALEKILDKNALDEIDTKTPVQTFDIHDIETLNKLKSLFWIKTISHNFGEIVIE
jgi:hypothetical protein